MLLRHFYTKNTLLLGLLTWISYILFTKSHSICLTQANDTHILPENRPIKVTRKMPEHSHFPGNTKAILMDFLLLTVGLGHLVEMTSLADQCNYHEYHDDNDS